MKGNSSLLVLVLILSLAMFLQACGKRLQNAPTEETTNFNADAYNISADAPGAVVSDRLLRLKGRWVKEIQDPNTPNPSMMRLRASANNTLSGRFLVGGGFNDTGVAMTVKEEGTALSLILDDDELRPHPWIPKRRVFTGKWDQEKLEMDFSTTDGEYIKFKFFPETENGYKMEYTANVYRCVLIPTPVATASPAASGSTTTTPATTTGSGSSSSGSSGSSGRSSSGGSHSNTGGDLRHIAAHLDITPVPLPNSTPVPPGAVTPPPPGSGVPAAAFNACGVMSSWREDWSRMSGI